MQKDQISMFSSTMPWLFFLTLSLFSLANIALADSHPSVSGKKVYIVYIEELPGQDPKDHAIKLLTSVLGSQKAANEALGYVYKLVVSGFSARLNPDQAARMRKQPGILGVFESITGHTDTAFGFN